MTILRPYQAEAINAAVQGLKTEGRALIVAATGSGKSVIAAHLAKRYLTKHPHNRVLVLCYVQEILESNNHECEVLSLDTGLFCAGLGRKDTSHSVIHASRDSLARNPLAAGEFDLVILDEAHMLSDDHKSRYQSILATLNPDFTVGMTATPYRLDGGLIYGKRKFWPRLDYSISHKTLVNQGKLVPYKIADCASLIDPSKLKVKAGEYETKSVETAVNSDNIIVESLRIWVEASKGRKCSLFFCHSIEHAQRCKELCNELYPYISTEYLDGTTNKSLRKQLVADMRDGAFSALFQVGTMTTGTNVPIIDCIVWLRPTLSATLWVQGSGRGSRLFPGKNDCLVIDLVGNLERFGSIYEPHIEFKSKKKAKFTDAELIAMGIDPAEMKGEAPTKECKECGTRVHAAAKKCDGCGNLFIILNVDFKKDIYKIKTMTVSDSVTSTGFPCKYVVYKTTCGRIEKAWYRKDLPYSKLKEKIAELENGPFTHVKVEPSKNPSFKNLTPLNLNSNLSSLPGSEHTGFSAGETIQPEFTTQSPGGGER